MPSYCAFHSPIWWNTPDRVRVPMLRGDAYAKPKSGVGMALRGAVRPMRDRAARLLGGARLVARPDRLDRLRHRPERVARAAARLGTTPPWHTAWRAAAALPGASDGAGRVERADGSRVARDPGTRRALAPGSVHPRRGRAGRLARPVHREPGPAPAAPDRGRGRRVRRHAAAARRRRSFRRARTLRRATVDHGPGARVLRGGRRELRRSGLRRLGVAAAGTRRWPAGWR